MARQPLPPSCGGSIQRASRFRPDHELSLAHMAWGASFPRAPPHGPSRELCLDHMACGAPANFPLQRGCAPSPSRSRRTRQQLLPRARAGAPASGSCPAPVPRRAPDAQAPHRAAMCAGRSGPVLAPHTGFVMAGDKESQSKRTCATGEGKEHGGLHADPSPMAGAPCHRLPLTACLDCEAQPLATRAFPSCFFKSANNTSRFLSLFAQISKRIHLPLNFPPPSKQEAAKKLRRTCCAPLSG